jgi:adenylate cyclase
MTESPVTRRVAAILAADAVGYTRLMADDEPATMAALEAARAVFSEHIEANQGRVVDTAGDSVLAVFEITEGAVLASVAIQGRLAEMNDSVPEDRRMRFRIGLHLGDIREKADDTVFGDGVNIAARLQSIAEPGATIVSDAVQVVLRGRPDIGFADAGSHEVKNVAEPVHAYRVVSDGDVMPANGTRPKSFPKLAIPAIVATLVVVVVGLAIWQTGPAPEEVENAAADSILALPTGPSIAVLPFDNMSGDPEQEYFADGMTEQIISELARFRDLFVIARNSTFQYKGQSPDVRTVAGDLGVRYVLEGSVRKTANTVRVTTQLLDGGSGAHLWTETYDAILTAENVFDIQDKISNQVVATLASDMGVLSRTDRWEARKSSTDNLQAYECVLLAQGYQQILTVENHRAVVDCLTRTVEIDPGYVDAWAWLSYVHYVGFSFGLTSNPEDLQLGLEAAREATRLDPTNQMARFAMANSHFFRGEIDAFREQTEIAISLNPNNTDVTAVLAEYFTYAVDWDRGVALMRKAMALNPMHPGWYWYPVAKNHLVRGELDEAITAARLINTPDDFFSYTTLAYIYASADRQAEAEDAVASALAANPDTTIEVVAQLYVMWNFPPDYIRRFAVDGLRKAGLPEGDLDSVLQPEAPDAER